MKRIIILASLMMSFKVLAADIPPFECSGKIFQADDYKTGTAPVVIPLVTMNPRTPEILSAKAGSVTFSAAGLFSMPTLEPEALLTITIYEDSTRSKRAFRARNATKELFEKGKTILVADVGENETISLHCKLK